MPTRLQLAKPQIVEFFDALDRKVFRSSELTQMIKDKRLQWRLPQTLDARQFIDFLAKEAKLQRIELHSDFRKEVRFAWGRPSPFEVALAIKPKSYLSHGTAVFIHGLTEQLPKTIYVNAEQSPKPASTGGLAQQAIDRAFSHTQRASNLIYTFDSVQAVLLSGKFTNRLEVAKIAAPDGPTVEVTKLERTLIDCVVRPSYAGGVHQVLVAFKNAKNRISVNTLLATLKKLDYVYPYHQAIGFYMERAGYDETRIAYVRKIPRHFDFYLAHDIGKKAFNESWRLWYPEGM